jgi:hypothetical protein
MTRLKHLSPAVLIVVIICVQACQRPTSSNPPDQQQSAITAAWEKRVATLETTKLGGGIGFHGWIREWDNSGPRHLSWGCVVMHLFDIKKLYDQIPEGTMVVIR